MLKEATHPPGRGYWQKYDESIYHDPSHPGSFTGPETLYKVVLAEGKFKIGRHCIRKWLQDQESYSLTRDARHKYNRSRVIVNGINSQADMDLKDMVDLAKQNDDYQYILVCINIFSRFTRCVPIKTKQVAQRATIAHLKTSKYF